MAIEASSHEQPASMPSQVDSVSTSPSIAKPTIGSISGGRLEREHDTAGRRMVEAGRRQRPALRGLEVAAQQAGRGGHLGGKRKKG
jgi:hypothetical protein